jgi:hypothetical protein
LLASCSFAEAVDNLPFAEEVSPTANNDFTVLKTNSTISKPFFNSTTSELTFNVTGPSNTSWYVWCKMSPNLIPDSKYIYENVKVFVDYSQINYWHAFNDGGCELYFEYTHSTHGIVISLPQENWTMPGVDPLIWAALLIAGFLLTTVFVFRHRKK